MRILIVSHGFPPHAQGGAEIYAHEHALAFARGGDQVLVLTRESNPTREEYSVREERRHGLTIAWVNNTFSRTASFADTYRNDGIRRVAASIIEGFAPDVAHVHHLTCLSTEIVRDLAAIGIPVFFTLHDYWLICHRGQLLDRQLNVCNGPEPSGCGACLGSAAGVGAGVYSARSALNTMERVLPSAVTRPLRAAGAFVAGIPPSRFALWRASLSLPVVTRRHPSLPVQVCRCIDVPEDAAIADRQLDGFRAGGRERVLQRRFRGREEERGAKRPGNGDRMSPLLLVDWNDHAVPPDARQNYVGHRAAGDERHVGRQDDEGIAGGRCQSSLNRREHPA